MANENEGTPSPKRRAISRRDLLVGAGGTAVLLALGALGPVGVVPSVRPPGGQNVDQLMAACVRCQKCYEACPRHVIVPSHLEDGIMQMRTPTMSFESDYCDFCADQAGGVPLCAQVCPTHALDLSSVTPKTVLGVAVVDESSCLAYRMTGCRFCVDACPYNAMEVDDLGEISVIADACNGCGACEAACVSLKEGSISSGATRRAITVRPLEEVYHV